MGKCMFFLQTAQICFSVSDTVIPFLPIMETNYTCISQSKSSSLLPCSKTGMSPCIFYGFLFHLHPVKYPLS